MTTDTKPTVDELLKPRYVLENEYPECPFNNGDILTQRGQSNAFGIEDNPYGILQEDLDKFPYLFRKLEWWQERSESEMPEYVKNIETGEIGKVFRWRNDCNEVFVGFKDNCCATKFYIPSTELDYLNFKN